VSDYAIMCLCMLAAYVVRAVANGLGARAVVERVALLEEKVDNIESLLEIEGEDDGDPGPDGGEELSEGQPALRLVGGAKGRAS
jgi:hypothetical protein